MEVGGRLGREWARVGEVALVRGCVRMSDTFWGGTKRGGGGGVRGGTRGWECGRGTRRIEFRGVEARTIVFYRFFPGIFEVP